MDNVLIGTVLKPQGIKGEVKVKAYTDDLDRFLHYKKFYIDNKEFFVEKGRNDGSFCYIKFSGISSMNDAELLRSKDLYISKDLLEEPSDNEYYYIDLEGSVIIVDGKECGKVFEVNDQTRNIVIECELNGKMAYFPFVKKVIERFDRKNKVLYLKGKELNEVTVFED